MFRNFAYFIKQSNESLFRNRLMTTASILTVSSSTFILIIFFVLVSNINYILDNFSNSIGMSIYVNENVSSEANEIFYKNIKDIKGIKEIVYTSKDKAFLKAKEIFIEQKTALDGLEENHPFPRSYEITLEQSDYGNDVYNELKKHLGDRKTLSSIKYAKSETNTLIAINKVIRGVSGILIIGLSFIAIVIIMNTITMAVASRKTEINIMKYVGATNNFIRLPFLIEGLVIGIVGAGLPLILSLLGYDRGIELLNSKLTMIEHLELFQPVEEIFTILIPAGFILGVVLGVLGSAIAIRKHLNV